MQPLVVDKYLPFDIIARNGALSQLYVEDKLERKSSASLLRTLLTQMAEMIPNIVERSFLGADFHVQRLTFANERRVEVRPGLWVIVNDASRQVRRVLPPSFDVHSHTVSKHVIDRGSVVCGLMFFMISLLFFLQRRAKETSSYEKPCAKLEVPNDKKLTTK